MDSRRFKQLRAQLGLSQARVAERSGYTPNTVARWERGELQVPKAVGELLEVLAQTQTRATTTGGPGGVSLDPLHSDILEALGQRLDPEAFEACAADLLRPAWPALVHVQGGNDYGVDGRVASTNEPPINLIVTTGRNARRSLTHSIKRQIASDQEPKRALFATSRGLTPRVRKGLFEVARELGVQLIEVYDQSWFALALYRESPWRQRLLNLSGRPRALSLIPASLRPLIGDEVIGRDRELHDLRAGHDDCIVYGAPGSGKTFALQAFAREGYAFFLTDTDRERLADDIRQLNPPAIIVDDAHLAPDVLKTLKHLRETLPGRFRIIAVSWPSEVPGIRSALSVPSSAEIALAPLDRDTIVEIIKAAGLRYATTPLLATIARQSEGRPGLAVTLSHLCLRGDVKGVVSGEALLDSLARNLQEVLPGDPITLLAAFGLGGASGCSPETVAGFLQKPIGEVNTDLVKLAAAGIIRQDPNRRISVWPEALRHVLVKRCFFDVPVSLSYKKLLLQLPNPVHALRTLIGARARGAHVPELEELLKGADSLELWLGYAFLGPREARYVFSQHPEKSFHLTEAFLQWIPEETIPHLLDCAVGDEMPPNSATTHPIRKISDWARDPRPGARTVMENRKTLLGAVERWWKGLSEERRPAAAKTALRATTAVFNPNLEISELDPGRGRTMRIGNPLLDLRGIAELEDLWPRAWKNILSEAAQSEWTEVFELLQEWLHTPPLARPSDETLEARDRVLSKMLKDVAGLSRSHPGVQHRLVQMTQHRSDMNLAVRLDDELEVLYPLGRLSDYIKNEEEWRRDAQALGEAWSEDTPESVAARVARIEREASLAGVRSYPRQSPTVCGVLAERASDPIRWARAFMAVSASADLVAKFVDKAVAASVEASRALLINCMDSELYAHLGAFAVLKNHPEFQELLPVAIERSRACPDIPSTLGLRGELKADVLPNLFLDSDLQLALATAIGVWNSSEKDELLAEDALRDLWRNVILRTADQDELPAHDNFWLAEILEADAELAQLWLRKVVNREAPHLAFRKVELAQKLARSIGTEGRRALLAELKPGPWGFDLVADIVGDDRDLFDDLLARKDLRRYHLEALAGQPSPAWAHKTVQAHGAGYSIEDIVRATLSGPHSWTGDESAMWTEWRNAFIEFVEDPRREVAQIARRGVELVDERISRSLEDEEREAIRGI